MKEVPELDMAELFENEEIMAGYLSEIMVTGDSELIMSAIGDIARAKGMSSINWDAVIKNADNVVLDEDDAPELPEEMMASAKPAREVRRRFFRRISLPKSSKTNPLELSFRGIRFIVSEKICPFVPPFDSTSCRGTKFEPVRLPCT